MAFGSLYPSMSADPAAASAELPDVGAPLIPSGPTVPGWAPTNRLFGLGGERRVVTWPEQLGRDAWTVLVNSAEGNVLPPGLRREDYTDEPAPVASTKDSTWFGRALNLPPVAAQPNDAFMEGAQSLAGMMGGGMMFGRMAGPAGIGLGRDLRVLGRQVFSDTATPGGPLAALESSVLPRRINPLENADQLKELANQRRARGENVGKSAEGWDFKRPDPEPGTLEWDAAVAKAEAAAKTPSPESPLLSAEDHDFINKGGFYEDAATAGAPVAALERVSAPAIVKTKLFDENGMPIPGAAYSKEARAALDEISAGPKGAGPMDLSTQAKVPNVPQEPLPRYIPPRGISPRMVEALQNPAVREGLQQSMEAGSRVSDWYHTDPVRRAFVDELGPKTGEAEFKRYMDTIAATSPRSDVPTNIRNASYYYSRGSPENLPAKNPYPYGHVAQNLHRGNFETISSEGGWNPLQNPKPASFAENLRGNLEPVTVDTHAFRNIGMRTGDPRFLETSFTQKLGPGERGPNSLASRFGEVKGQIVTYRPQQLLKEGKITMEEAQKIPAFWASKPRESEYAAAEGLFRETGNKLGLRPADAQAAAWAGGGEMTGLGTVGTHTFPELMNERVLFTAKMRGENPQKTLSDFIRGKATLLEDAATTGAPISALEHAAGAPDAAKTAAREAAAPARGDGPGGAGGGDASLREAQAAATRRAGAHQPLEGLPTKAMKIGDEHFVPGPIGKVRDVAAQYMADRETPSYHTPPTKYHPLDEEHSKAVARAFDEMDHNPNDPATKASYDALINETAAQYQAVKKSGLKIEPIPKDMPDPYAKNPRLAAKDVADNNHLWFFPTDAGFGSNPGAKIDMATHPMMRKTGEKIGDHELLANDMFRIVHDYFGHLKEGYGFRAAGEDNAWRSHASMYSDVARPAMTTETRGQNSWVNYGPHGERNRTASAADTVYADQKVGLMPEWTMRDRGSPEPIIAYHGSPYSFDRFGMKHIGTGEGNAAYGEGLYFGGHSPVSEWYRHQLSARRDPILPRHGLDSQDGAHVGIRLAATNGDPAPVIADLEKEIAGLRRDGDTSKGTQNMIQRRRAMVNYLNDPERNKGHMYQVAIDAKPEEFLDWDKPLKDQPKALEAVRKVVPEWLRPPFEKNVEHGITGGNAYQNYAIPDPPTTGNKEHPHVRTSRALRDVGVPGIKYLDQGSRSKGGGTSNYVTFNAPRILKKYAVPGLIGAGGFGSLAPRREQ